MKDSLESFTPYLKAFATGPKGNHDLTYEQTYDASQMILNQELPNEVVGAFLMTWRVKGESSDEMLGALAALKKTALPLSPLADSLEIAMPMEGKKKNIPLLILTAQYLKTKQFVVTASPAMREESAVSLLDLSDYLPENIHLISRDKYLPKLESLHKLRQNLKLRTVFNTLEKLHHPLQSDYAVVGAHHGPYFKKYADLFSHQYKRMMVVQGDEGCGEIIKKSKIHLIEAGKLTQEFTLDPKTFGIEFKKSEEILSLDRTIEQIFNPSHDLRELARLNAAIYCYTMDPSSSIQEYFTSL